MLERAAIGPSDRVLLGLPLTWSVGADAYAALLDLGALIFAPEAVSLADTLELAPTVLLSTLTDALRIAHAAADERIDLSLGPLRLAIITAEPGASLDVTRRLVENRWGATCLDVYAVTEFGLIGSGCQERHDGIHLDEQQLSVDVVSPDSGQRVGEGVVGELVVTTPADWDTPLADFRTGDLVRLRTKACECGRGSAWAESGVLGRVGERLRVRGRVILPSSIEQIVRRHPAVVDFALRAYTVRDECEVTVDLEASELIATEGDRARVAAEVSEDLKRSLGLRMNCEIVGPKSISATHAAGHRARRLTFN